MKIIPFDCRMCKLNGIDLVAKIIKKKRKEKINQEVLAVKTVYLIIFFELFKAFQSYCG